MPNRLVSIQEIADDLDAYMDSLKPTPGERKLALLGLCAVSLDGVPLMSKEEFKARAEQCAAEIAAEKAAK